MSSLIVNRLLGFPVIDVLAYYGYRAKRYGSRSKMRCPFHEETMASFTVYHDDNKCYCFGCAKTWDGVGLVKDFEKVRFTPAIIKLAKIAGVQISDDDVLNIRKQIQRGSCLIRDGHGDRYWREVRTKILDEFVDWCWKLPHVKHLFHIVDFFFNQLYEVGLVEWFGAKQLDETKDLIFSAKKILAGMSDQWIEFFVGLEIPREHWAEKVGEDLGSPFVGNW